MQDAAALAARTTAMGAQLARQAAEDRAARMQRQRAAAQKRKADKVIWAEILVFKNKMGWNVRSKWMFC